MFKPEKMQAFLQSVFYGVLENALNWNKPELMQ